MNIYLVLIIDIDNNISYEVVFSDSKEDAKNSVNSRLGEFHTVYDILRLHEDEIKNRGFRL